MYEMLNKVKNCFTRVLLFFFSLIIIFFYILILVDFYSRPMIRYKVPIISRLSIINFALHVPVLKVHNACIY